MRTALVRVGTFLINLNQITYGRVEPTASGKWKFTLYLGSDKVVFWTFSEKVDAESKLDYFIEAANEISLTEVLG